MLHARGRFRLVALEDIAARATILRIAGVIGARPDRHSIQIDDRRHVVLPTGLALDEQLVRCPWRFMNHSCAPNARVRGRDVVAVRRIAPFDEIAYDYNTTEEVMAAPFRCRCGSAKCDGAMVRGFQFLSVPERARRRFLLRTSLRRRLGAGD